MWNKVSQLVIGVTAYRYLASQISVGSKYIIFSPKNVQTFIMFYVYQVKDLNLFFPILDNQLTFVSSLDSVHAKKVSRGVQKPVQTRGDQDQLYTDYFLV